MGKFDLLSAGEGFVGTLLEQKKRRSELEDAIALLTAKSKLDPDTQAKARILEMATKAGRVPQPAGGYSPQERQIGAPEAVEEAARNRELEFLQHILPRSAATSTVPLMVFNPDTGTYEVQGTTARGTVVRNKPKSEDLLTREAEAKSKGTQQTKYNDLVKQFDFISQDVDSVLDALEKIPAGRINYPGSKAKQIVGAPGSEDVFQYENTRDLIVSKIAKTFGGEVGVLTEGDVQRIRKAFPEIWMNPREREAQITWIKDYIQRRLDAYGSSQRGGSRQTDFSSVEEAESAQLPSGTRITINGRQAVVE